MVSLAFAHSMMSTCQEFTQRLHAGSSDDFQVSTCNHKANSYQLLSLSPSSITKGPAIHHPLSTCHLDSYSSAHPSGISYTERLRAQATALEQLTRLLLEDSFSFGDAEA